MPQSLRMSHAEYNPGEIEKYWQNVWRKNQAYHVEIQKDKPKYYALDMFPYPSGAGLHVGHPLGYIASDIVSRYKRHKGYNVLHPMGYDAFGLPAEQYAVETGQHPSVTTENNIQRYRFQLDRIGFSFDWDREVRTSDPYYYRWTQWIFMQLFNHWYNKKSNKAEHIDNLIAIFENEGNVNVDHEGDYVGTFTAEEWIYYSDQEKEDILQNYRLAFRKETTVNWCEALGTVLANEEVKDGLSERGGHPVVRKQMMQWFLRITAYADRLLEGLDQIDWSDSIKEIQRNWIGRSEGASARFLVSGTEHQLEIFTTRPDTIFGSTFMVIAPEHELATTICSEEQREEVEEYIATAVNRSERDRMSDVNRVTGVFTGAFCDHPFTGEQIPIWVADYVLAGYGTGAIMAVPGHDTRDHAFAKAFKLPIVQVIDDPKQKVDVQKEPFDSKDGVLINSDFIDGMPVDQAIATIIEKLEDLGFGQGKTNYKLRDAGFGRQRYWGEPIPVMYKDGLPTLIDEAELPLELPQVESYKPTGTGESPLAAVEEWVETETGMRETDTMPGWAGSSWYFFRYMDPENDFEFASREAINYWGQVDLYLGGSEHATGHLLYARFWTKFLYDIQKVKFDEPFKKLINQGMIQGVIESLYLKKEKVDGLSYFKCAKLVDKEGSHDDYIKIPILIDFVNDYGTDESYLDTNSYRQFINWRPDYKSAVFECENGIFESGYFKPHGNEGNAHFHTVSQVGKMSKRLYNVVNPDHVCDEYGADTLRMYEMFLGPLTDSKPWSTKGIDGVYRFLRKLWKVYIDADGTSRVNDDEASEESLKTVHKTIKKVTSDIENYSFNTAISSFMICVNELSSQNCTNRDLLQRLAIALSPFAPHLAEELWSRMGNENSILDESWPDYDESYLVEATKTYPISINGKARTKMELPLDMEAAQIEEKVLENEIVQKWLDGKKPKRMIVVPGKIINVVV